MGLKKLPQTASMRGGVPIRCQFSERCVRYGDLTAGDGRLDQFPQYLQMRLQVHLVGHYREGWRATCAALKSPNLTDSGRDFR
jgi:hypothetical protein